MHAVTIREAKARLNALVEAAERGEQVVLMRGAKHVAAIVPLSADDLEVSSRITDAQAERLWRQIAEERRDGSSEVKESAEAAPCRRRAASPCRPRHPEAPRERRRCLRDLEGRSRVAGITSAHP